MAKKVVVVRVGTETIRIVHMDNTPVNPTVYGCVRVPTPEGAVVDGEVKNIIDVSRRIKQACIEKGITTKDVIFSLASSKIANRETTIPFVKDSKIQGIVDAKVGDMFPVDKERYIFSYVKQGDGRSANEDEEVTDGSENKEEEPEITDDTKKKEKKSFNLNLGKKEGAKPVERVIDLLVYAAPLDLVRSYYALAEGCEFNVVAIEVDGNGIFQIMKRQVKEGVEMAVQINRSNTLINIMSNEKLLLQRTIPYGSDAIIEAAMSEPAFQVPEYDKAAKLLASQRVLLHTLSASNPQGDLSMEKRIELTQSAASLIGNISRVMEYYNSRYREEPVRSIIVTGNGASIAGIHELIINELGVPAVTPNELQGVQFNRQIEVNANILQYVGCFGAVYTPVNFVPEEIKNRVATKDSLMSIALVFAASIVICIVMAVASIVMLSAAKTENEAEESRLKSLKPVEVKYNTLMDSKEKIATYLMVKNDVNTNNNRLHAILDDIKERCPKDFRIDAVNMESTGGSISCTTNDKISSVAALVVRLNLISDIQNVDITSAITKTEDKVTQKRQYKYTISFDYISNYDQMDPMDKDYFGDALYDTNEGEE